jgi:hypothetical protein
MSQLGPETIFSCCMSQAYVKNLGVLVSNCFRAYQRFGFSLLCESRRLTIFPREFTFLVLLHHLFNWTVSVTTRSLTRQEVFLSPKCSTKRTSHRPSRSLPDNQIYSATLSVCEATSETSGEFWKRHARGKRVRKIICSTTAACFYSKEALMEFSIKDLLPRKCSKADGIHKDPNQSSQGRGDRDVSIQ